MKEYAERDVMDLDEQGDYYIRHISAMTGESLHSKSDIAAELGYRDCEIDRLLNELKDLSRSAKIVLDSINSGDYIPEFRYKNLESNIESSRDIVSKQRAKDLS